MAQGPLKYLGVVGVGEQATKGTAVTPTVYPVCEDSNIESEPVQHERITHLTADRLEPLPAGFNHSFTVDGMEADATSFGRVAAICLGNNVEAGSGPYTHTITPIAVAPGTPPYATIILDRNEDMDASNNEAERLTDAMIESLDHECSPRQFAKTSFKGPAISKDAYTGITGSLPANTPLAWAHIVAASGFIKLQVNDGTLTQDDTIESFNMSYSRPVKNDKFTAASNQPSDLIPGQRELTFEVVKAFSGYTEYAAFVAQQELGIDVMYYISASLSVQITIPHATFEGSLLGGVGAGEEEIKATIKGKAFYNGSDPIITIVVTDSVASY